MLACLLVYCLQLVFCSRPAGSNVVGIPRCIGKTGEIVAGSRVSAAAGLVAEVDAAGTAGHSKLEIGSSEGRTACTILDIHSVNRNGIGLAAVRIFNGYTGNIIGGGLFLIFISLYRHAFRGHGGNLISCGITIGSQTIGCYSGRLSCCIIDGAACYIQPCTVNRSLAGCRFFRILTYGESPFLEKGLGLVDIDAFFREGGVDLAAGACFLSAGIEGG